ncbi:MAG: SDR family oxidoreductase [Pseudomonadota bacterium]|nr:SDR family oxidoreductase [Pseudomonadota bacterium]
MNAVLDQHIAIVTGGDSGIGAATAREFAREGADVALTYLHDEQGAAQTAREITAAGRRALVIACDQRDPAAVAKLFAQVEQALGVPSLLVNNAGVNFSGERVVEMGHDTWDLRLKTDLYGPFYCCQQFIQARRSAGGGGRIINITSIHEETPMPGAAAYDAAKGGLRNLTRTLAMELAGERINVNNIAPGMILTPMNEEAVEDPDVRARQTRHIPWGRAGEPREVARLAVYLASDDAAYITGQSITIDGGLTVQST